MGRQPAYGFILKKLRQIWERKGKIDVFDLENEFYLVSFQHTEDYMGALIGGPWVIADAYLVVKLMGRQPVYGFILKKLRQIWERKGKIDVFDLENEFYLVSFQHTEDYMGALIGGPWVIASFQHTEDYMGALIGGPWVIADAYLSVSHCKPEFNPRNAKIESLIAWIRVPELPATLFDKKFLLNLGNAIGKAIRLDIHTAQRSRGKFARMCVELDLTKPLVPSFSVEGQKFSVVYESLNNLCTNCGWFGHSKEVCEGFHKAKAEEGMEVESQGDLRNDEGVKEDTKEVWKTVQRVRRL
ncbi:hypothetical protein K1719_038739 [Acacia pycnantha]|nr:hypothetical protein K1719_038739 [Acacia pycnantha]